MDDSGSVPMAAARSVRSERGEFTHYRFDPNDSTSLSNDYVRDTYHDSRGNLWVGTQGGAWIEGSDQRPVRAVFVAIRCLFRTWTGSYLLYTRRQRRFVVAGQLGRRIAGF